MTGFYRFCKALTYVFLKICYKYKVIDAENLPESGGIVLCCNHQSIHDAIIIGNACKNRQLYFMGKEELFRFKPLGALFRKLGAFPVRRGKGDSNAIDMAKSIVKDGKVFMIFPEGKRSKDGTILRAKSGAAVVAVSCDAPIVPAAIKYSSTRHIFCKATVIIGKPIDIKMQDNSRGEIRRITNEITDHIKELYEQI